MKFARFGKRKFVGETSSSRSKLSIYFSSDMIVQRSLSQDAESFKILEWWKARDSHFHVLSIMVCNILYLQYLLSLLSS